VGSDHLMTTTEAAKAIGIARGTLAGYVRRGWVKPFLTLPSGQHRWKLDDLVAQLRSLRERDE
jgi:predicted site-specific integrase-resolvase